MKKKCARLGKRLLGALFLLIGLWLLWEMISNCRIWLGGPIARENWKSFWGFGGGALMLITCGGALLHNPDIFDGA